LGSGYHTRDTCRRRKRKTRRKAKTKPQEQKLSPCRNPRGRVGLGRKLRHKEKRKSPKAKEKKNSPPHGEPGFTQWALSWPGLLKNAINRKTIIQGGKRRSKVEGETHEMKDSRKGHDAVFEHQCLDEVGILKSRYLWRIKRTWGEVTPKIGHYHRSSKTRIVFNMVRDPDLSTRPMEIAKAGKGRSGT